jgi:hypothetical protein
MKRIYSVLAAFAVLIFVLTPIAAHASGTASQTTIGGISSVIPHAGTYHFDEGYACESLCNPEVFIDLHTTNTGTQIWINGTPSCFSYNGAKTTWCGYVGSSNGTSKLEVGFNFNGLWYRFDIPASGNCSVRGDVLEMGWNYCKQ